MLPNTRFRTSAGNVLAVRGLYFLTVVSMFGCSAMDFLRAVPEDQVALHFRDPHSAGELRPATSAEGARYRYVIMPMRI